MVDTKFNYMVSAICPACWKRDTGCDHIGSFKPDCPVANNSADKISNADKIRAMSDTELAKFLRETIEVSAHNLFDCDGRECTECENCYLEWLQSEAE